MADGLVIEFTESAFRHNIAEEDIRHALNVRIHSAMINTLPEKHAIIGLDRSLNRLEIMFNQIDDDTIPVFHAMRLRSSFAKKYDL